MKIVVLDGYALNPGDLSWEGIKKWGDVTIYDRTPPENILERAEGAEIIFTNKTPLSGDVINKLDSLKFIGVLATGYNIIDIEMAARKGIIVSNVPGYGTDSVVQMTFALLLELCQHVQRHSDSVMNGKWVHSPDWCFWDFPLIELSGKTMGIIGYGRIGRKVGELATAFGMNLIAAGRTMQDESFGGNCKQVDLNQLLVESDVISLHCPLLEETRGMINKTSLQKMKRSAFLINTSRGPLVHERDLADALNNDIIAGAGLDVLSLEPPSANNPLLKAKNCIITPHIAWATKEARSRLMEITVKNLNAYISRRPINIINR
jgi:glycerate dehydrogenase